MSVELSDVIEDKDIHAVYVERYRAGYLARDLWRLAAGRTHWRTMAPVPTGGSGGSSGFTVAGAGSLPKARYLDVEVPACACLGVRTHKLRLTAHDMRAGMRDHNKDEADAWEDYLMWPKLSSIFHLVTRWSMVRRADTASADLARAALKLVSHATAM